MKVVALISGGKDSCYNMMHCVANGHKIVALANLHPAPSAPDELDSWMYQTVGHDIVPLYAEAMDLPMYRQIIAGTNVAQDLHYNQSDGDETEDLFNLIQQVKQSHPDVTGISVGAIASSYQRLRVEHVASRFNLTVLAFVWEADQSQLLSSMIDSGLVAILIKVAAVGLTTKHLGQTLQQMQPTLMKLHALYEVHPCGEGGEYETIVLDCPLFKKRLELTSSTIVELEADTAHLRLTAKLAPSQSALVERSTWQSSLFPTQHLCEQSQAWLSQVHEVKAGPVAVAVLADPLAVLEDDEQYYGMLTCRRIIIKDGSFALHERLPGSNEEILFCSLVLRDMADFSTVNQEYAQLWRQAHPPARVCISTRLTEDPSVKAVLHMISIAADHERVEDCMPDKRLWVQSRSCWAPSNIGPYSQLTQSCGIAFISGQIGLLPHSMQMPETFDEEVCWSLQSLQRIVVSQRVDSWQGILVCYILNMALAEKVQRACDLWMDGSRRMRLVIVEIQPGSQMPRGAQVEWQTILSQSGEIQLRTDRDASTALSMAFFTKGAAQMQTQDHLWLLPVSRLRIEGALVDYASIVLPEK